MHKLLKVVLAAFTFITGLLMVTVCLAQFIPPNHGLSLGFTLFAATPFLLCATLLYWVCQRPNLAPDFLERISKRYFDRGGLCFVVMAPEKTGPVCHLPVYYQNRYARPCDGTIVISLAGGPSHTTTLPISCAGGAFGKVTIPWAIPRELQGKTATYSLAASVHYPRGRGSMLRSRDGLASRSISGRFETFLTVFLLINWHLSHNPSPKISIFNPSEVFTPEDLKIVDDIHNETFWKYGDSARWEMPLPNKVNRV